MAKPFAIKDRVEWRSFGIKCDGTIESIDKDLGLMTVYVGHFCGNEVTHTVKKIKGRWLAFRPSHDYLDRIHRIKP